MVSDDGSDFPTIFIVEYGGIEVAKVIKDRVIDHQEALPTKTAMDTWE